jgi:hypothetical protein
MWRCPQAGEDTHTEACMHGVGEDAHRSDPSERYTSEVVGVARWTRDEPAEPTPHKTVFFSFRCDLKKSVSGFRYSFGIRD